MILGGKGQGEKDWEERINKFPNVKITFG